MKQTECDLKQTEFRASTEVFLQSVKDRNWSTFERYLLKELEFCAVLPGGKIYRDVPSFLESQISWFRGTTGSFEFSIERTEVSGNLGAAFATVKYSDIDAQGKPFSFEIFISFLFRNVNGQWHLIHDQNTVLRETR